MILVAYQEKGFFRKSIMPFQYLVTRGYKQIMGGKVCTEKDIQSCHEVMQIHCTTNLAIRPYIEGMKEYNSNFPTYFKAQDTSGFHFE